ncbi:MAG TPA: hypothetical protein PKG54_09660 [Phycisphaerae bacterium]|jgi:hypothetical protein|nr:hypothetical protein [Phycisphaerae bacterium]HOB74781.1 hypothetical protein [Phycisphaerae bacterium]HOJ54384.1 hypothetical protein [Phycisphaerae bacterium]HOL26855.1 hypothetical protein [Phycisphaerae bacterium]HPP20016.1 hypothetical protein [Phycisphaerae bacterium]
MVKVIPARISEGNVVPKTPLPSAESIRSIFIVVELADPEESEKRESTLPRMLGLLKGADVSEEDYVRYLEEKYR